MAHKFTIHGRVPSKKNSRRAIYVKGRTIMIANKDYDAWHRAAAIELAAQRPGKFEKIKEVRLAFFPPDRVRRDLSNMTESVLDLLADCGVIPDDNLFVVGNLKISFEGVDRANPRVEIIIEK